MNNIQSKLTVKTVVSISLMVALSIILTRFFSISTPTLRIGFGDIPVMLSGMFLGPVAGAITGLLADLIGFAINPLGPIYFPGFTISAALRGALFGWIFMYVRNRKSKLNFNIVNIIVVIVLAIGIILTLNKSVELVFSNWRIGYQILFVLVVIAFALLPMIITKYYKQRKEEPIYELDKILFSVTLTYIVISIGLNTYWLSILYGKAFLIMLPSRIVTGLVVIPVHSLILYVLSGKLKKIIK